MLLIFRSQLMFLRINQSNDQIHLSTQAVKSEEIGSFFFNSHSELLGLTHKRSPSTLHLFYLNNEFFKKGKGSKQILLDISRAYLRSYHVSNPHRHANSNLSSLYHSQTGKKANFVVVYSIYDQDHILHFNLENRTLSVIQVGNGKEVRKYHLLNASDVRFNLVDNLILVHYDNLKVTQIYDIRAEKSE